MYPGMKVLTADEAPAGVFCSSSSRPSAFVTFAGVAFVGRNAALTLLAIATTLTINVINNLQFMQKNDFAKAAFTKEIINVTYAGALSLHQHPACSTVNNPRL